MQYAAVAALNAPPEYEATLREGYRTRRDRLIDGLASVGLRGATPAAGYFILCDISDFGHEDDMAFVHHLITTVGVTAIPASPFYASSDEGRSLVRFAFCKPIEAIDAAIERLLATPLRV
jgi:aspartate/methionine/tyrosine aminotransferase